MGLVIQGCLGIADRLDRLTYNIIIIIIIIQVLPPPLSRVSP